MCHFYKTKMECKILHAQMFLLVCISLLLDGCELWNYTSPLQSSIAKCSTGGLIPYNTTCTFDCDAGFQLHGTRSTQCLDNGELSSTLPKCEAIQCTLPHFPPNLRSTNATCANGSHIEYLTKCRVYCDAGYQLVGNNQITCLATGKIDKPLPVCEDQTSMSPGVLVAVILTIILIAVVLTSIGIRMLITKIGRARDEHPEEEIPLQDMDEQMFINWIENYIQLFTEQLPNDSQLDNKTLRKVHQTLKVLERNVILSLANSKPFEYKRAYIQQAKASTEREAWALYTAVLTSFADDWRMKWRQENRIIYILSNDDASTSSAGLSAKSDDQLSRDYAENKQMNNYLEIIHSAFGNLIQCYRDGLEGDDRKEFTRKVTGTVKSYNKLHKKRLEAGKQTRTRTFNRAGISEHQEGNCMIESDELADLCINNLNAFHRIDDKIKLRQNILEAILTKSINQLEE